ncbi:MAG: TonB-dependent receptor [Alphaproteobacteria bacterium]|nr:TonB-dependent receptor [Alphaproteobacteria bacterium]
MRFFTLTLAAALAATSALAAPKSDPIVITPNRQAVPLSQVASSVTVISEEQIMRSQRQTVGELLRTVPGVDVVRSGGVGQTTSVFLRGAKSEHTLVLIDGVPVNDPSATGNTYDFAHLTTDNIARIEVLRGPQSTLYGSDAIGGVIQIFTKRGTGKPRVSGYVEGGSHTTGKAGATVNGASGRVDYNVHASHLGSRGISTYSGGSEDDGYRNTHFSTNLGYAVTDNAKLRGTARYTDSSAEYDDFGADANNKAHGKQLTLRGEGELALMNGRWKQTLGVSHHQNDRKDDSTYGHSEFKGKRTKADWLHHLNVHPNDTITVGAEAQRESYNGDTNGSKSVNTVSALAENRLTIGDASLHAGARIDDHETFGSKATYRVAPAYHITQTNTKLRASYGTGFKAPSLYQLYSMFGNRNLNPEKSRGYDIGVDQAFLGDKVNASLTWFDTTATDLIDYDFATNAYTNVGKAKQRGIEAGVTYAPMNNVTVGANYTYLQAKDEQTGERLVRRPRHKATVFGDVRFLEKGSAGADIVYVGSREDFDLSFSRAKNDAYTTVNLHSAWKFNDAYEIYGRVENLFDKRYEDIIGYGTPGLSVYAGVRTGF